LKNKLIVKYLRRLFDGNTLGKSDKIQDIPFCVTSVGETLKAVFFRRGFKTSAGTKRACGRKLFASLAAA
jgi:hypothetical protein